MLKIGILSTAHMHADSYADEINNRSDVELVGLWDPDADRLAAKASQYKTPAFANRDELFALCDAVLVCSENIHHREMTEAAAKAGKSVLCEKPLATTPEDARAMVDACRSANVGLFTAFPCRFSPAFIALKGAVDRGELGDILALRGTNRGKCPGGWFVDPLLSGGGAVMDHTVHVTDLLRVLLKSEVVSVFCEADNKLLPGDFDDTGIVNLQFASGAFATIDCSWSRPRKTFPTWGDVTIAVQGTRATVSMDMFAQANTVYSETDSRIGYAGYGSSTDAGLVGAFIRAVTTGVVEDIATGEDGLRAVEVVTAAYESVRTHKVVGIG